MNESTCKQTPDFPELSLEFVDVGTLHVLFGASFNGNHWSLDQLMLEDHIRFIPPLRYLWEVPAFLWGGEAFFGSPFCCGHVPHPRFLVPKPSKCLFGDDYPFFFGGGFPY